MAKATHEIYRVPRREDAKPEFFAYAASAEEAQEIRRHYQDKIDPNAMAMEFKIFAYPEGEREINEFVPASDIPDRSEMYVLDAVSKSEKTKEETEND